ncbi:hypothetical protein TNCT_188341 [Trichonephila clavata]|uniref:Uncharacterized protein n=1 Tax=Trichonephila clavata TaxID=2740835 RepID=A0A8X6GMR8_TRICU|nr:hypothetical protein TNCT_188341 [Trichonephila clavata]
MNHRKRFSHFISPTISFERIKIHKLSDLFHGRMEGLARPKRKEPFPETMEDSVLAIETTVIMRLETMSS